MNIRFYTQTANFNGLNSFWDFLENRLQNGTYLKKVQIKVESIIEQQSTTIVRSGVLNPINSLFNFRVYFARLDETIIAFSNGNSTSNGNINAFDIESYNTLSFQDAPFTTFRDVARYNLTKTIFFNKKITGRTPIRIETNFWNPPPGGSINNHYTVNLWIGTIKEKDKEKDDERLYTG